jgi:hypothetical protein
MKLFGRVDRLLFTVMLVGLAALIVQSLPDIKRYLMIRSMGDSRQQSELST